MAFQMVKALKLKKLISPPPLSKNQRIRGNPAELELKELSLRIPKKPKRKPMKHNKTPKNPMEQLGQ